MITWITDYPYFTRIIWTIPAARHNHFLVTDAVDLYNDGTIEFFEPDAFPAGLSLAWLTRSMGGMRTPYRVASPMDDKLATLLLFCQKQGIRNLDDLPPAFNPFYYGTGSVNWLCERRPPGSPDFHTGLTAQRMIVQETRPPFRRFLVDRATAEEIIDHE